MLAQWLRRNAHRVSPNVLRHITNWWSPLRGAGIKVTYVSPDYREVVVTLTLHWYNKNYVGTHFGGSLYAMTDPFYMIMLINNLGPNYIVWDKAAKIEFVKPGRSTVTAHFELSTEEIVHIKLQADTMEKYIFDRPVDIVADSGEIVARVVKTLYVRRKHHIS